MEMACSDDAWAALMERWECFQGDQADGRRARHKELKPLRKALMSYGPPTGRTAVSVPDMVYRHRLRGVRKLAAALREEQAKRERVELQVQKTPPPS